MFYIYTGKLRKILFRDKKKKLKQECRDLSERDREKRDRERKSKVCD